MPLDVTVELLSPTRNFTVTLITGFKAVRNSLALHELVLTKANLPYSSTITITCYCPVSNAHNRRNMTPQGTVVGVDTEDAALTCPNCMVRTHPVQSLAGSRTWR